MPKTVKDMDKFLDEFNDTVDELRKKEIKVEDKDLPSNMKLMLGGVSNSKAIEFLFSHNIDKLLDRLFELASAGDIENLLNNEKEIKDIFKLVGLGEGSFEGPISKSVIKSIKLSVQSINFQKIKNMFFKMLYIINNLKRQSKYFKDKEQRKKYEDAVYAIKRVMMFAYIIYFNRKIINNRVFNGLKNIVNESQSIEEELISIDSDFEIKE
jgi:hypothetical protein